MDPYLVERAGEIMRAVVVAAETPWWHTVIAMTIGFTIGNGAWIAGRGLIRAMRRR